MTYLKIGDVARLSGGNVNVIKGQNYFNKK